MRWFVLRARKPKDFFVFADDRSLVAVCVTHTQGRFNIYPELIVGTLYRVRRHLGLFAAQLGAMSPSAFYYRCVFVWNGVSAGLLFVTGFELSGTLAGAALPTLLFATHYKFATQVQWSPTLRECWALPCFPFDRYG